MMGDSRKDMTAEEARRITSAMEGDIQHEIGKLRGAVNSYAKTGSSNLETAFDRNAYSEDAIKHIATRLEADGFTVNIGETREWHILKVDWAKRPRR